MHPRTVIGRNVKLYGGVTIGRADTYHDVAEDRASADPGLVNVNIGDGVVVGAGSKVLFSSRRGRIDIGDGAVIGANAVLVDQDVPAGERWGGIPARRLS